MQIKDFDKFQHFKDRSPPWIKLYRDILDDPDWHALDAESAKILVMLWLVASEDKSMNGNLPDVRKLAFRLRIDPKQLEKSLNKLSHWVEQDDINPISDVYQDDAPEKRREETEKETENKSRSARFNFVGALVSSGVSESLANDYVSVRKAKKCVQTETAFNLFSDEVKKSGLSYPEAVSICCKKNWGGFESAWVKQEDRASIASSGNDPEELITLPDGKQITRKRQQWLLEMMK